MATERRSAEVTTGEGRVLEGMPIVFSTPATIRDGSGSFVEVIDPHALDGCDLSDVTLRTEHDTGGVPLARTPDTLSLEVTPTGLSMRATLADTESGREVHEAVRRRDLRGMSFAFVVAPGGSRYDPETNTRTVTSIERILEVSLVANPAYATTSVEARSQITEALRREGVRRELIVLANQVIAAI